MSSQQWSVISFLSSLPLIISSLSSLPLSHFSDFLDLSLPLALHASSNGIRATFIR
ncbi:hypothetical protein Syun_009743 [Stephania yunnanensis]|uniref:Uncharacterized protein n=1 Tax=Stephania yunnanensis TaxID=152371 RepID=A0AAP0PQY7_9MAGN